MIRIIGEDMIDATDWNYKHIAYETDLAGELPKTANSSNARNSFYGSAEHAWARRDQGCKNHHPAAIFADRKIIRLKGRACNALRQNPYSAAIFLLDRNESK